MADRTYHMVILKNEGNRLPGAAPGVIRDERFTISVIPQRENYMQALGEAADLLVIDLCVQPRQGLDIIRKLRVEGKKTEVIAYISQTDTQTLFAALRLGVVDCITRPFEAERFNYAVERFLYRVRPRQGRATQELADKLLCSTAVPKRQLPKGLQKETLNRIRLAFSSCPDERFSCDDIVEAVQLSRITVQRYIAYLSQTKELTQDMHYDTGGRPRSLYRYNHAMFA